MNLRKINVKNLYQIGIETRKKIIVHTKSIYTHIWAPFLKLYFYLNSFLIIYSSNIYPKPTIIQSTFLSHSHLLIAHIYPELPTYVINDIYKHVYYV